MSTKLGYLMRELAYANKKLGEFQHGYMRAVREEMEFAHFDKGISDYYKSAIEAGENSIAAIQKRIDAIADNEVFIERFGEPLHALYKRETPGFDKFTKVVEVETSWNYWDYLIPGEPSDFESYRTSPVVPMSALPKRKSAEFTSYKNKSLYISLAYAPEINTVFVRV